MSELPELVGIFLFALFNVEDSKCAVGDLENRGVPVCQTSQSFRGVLIVEDGLDGLLVLVVAWHVDGGAFPVDNDGFVTDFGE